MGLQRCRLLPPDVFTSTWTLTQVLRRPFHITASERCEQNPVLFLRGAGGLGEPLGRR